MEWAFVVSYGVSVTSYGPHYKALRCLLCFLCRDVFNLIFNCPNVGGRSIPKVSTMVPLDIELVSSHMQAVNTKNSCIWYHFAAICDASFDCGLPTPSLGKGWWSYGVGDRSPE